MADNDQPASGRRPLQTRNWRFFQWLADFLARSGVGPNAISVSSVVFAVGAGATLAGTGQLKNDLTVRICWIASAALLQLRLIANLLDGMVAIEGGKKSPVGDLYNEIPDRISDPAILIGAGFAVGGHPLLGMGAAVIALFVAYIRAIGASVGVGQVFVGPMAKPQRMAILTVTCLYCGLVPSTWQPVYAEGFGIVAGALALIVLGALFTSRRRLLKIAALLKQEAD